MTITITLFEDCHAGDHPTCPGATEIDGQSFFCTCGCH